MTEEHEAVGDERDAVADVPMEPMRATLDADGEADAGTRREPRPLLERIGLAAVASVLAIMFGGVAAASWIGGEPFLAVMGGVGCVMTAWVGALTLFRG